MPPSCHSPYHSLSLLSVQPRTARYTFATEEAWCDWRVSGLPPLPSCILLLFLATHTSATFTTSRLYFPPSTTPSLPPSTSNHDALERNHGATSTYVCTAILTNSTETARTADRVAWTSRGKRDALPRGERGRRRARARDNARRAARRVAQLEGLKLKVVVPLAHWPDYPLTMTRILASHRAHPSPLFLPPSSPTLLPTRPPSARPCVLLPRSRVRGRSSAFSHLSRALGAGVASSRVIARIRRGRDAFYLFEGYIDVIVTWRMQTQGAIGNKGHLRRSA